MAIEELPGDVARKNEAKKALEAADVTAMHKLFLQAQDDVKQMTQAVAIVADLYGGNSKGAAGFSLASEDRGIAAVRDIALAAIEMAKQIVMNDAKGKP